MYFYYTPNAPAVTQLTAIDGTVMDFKSSELTVVGNVYSHNLPAKVFLLGSATGVEYVCILGSTSYISHPRA